MSRVTGIIILILIAVSFGNFGSVAQDRFEPDNFSKKAVKTARRQVKKLSFEELATRFDLEQLAAIKVANLDTLKEIAGYPMPSAAVLKANNTPLPDYLADALGVHYFYQLDPNSNAAFYAMDTVVRELHVTPYTDENKIYEALLSHNFLMSGETDISSLVQQNKPVGKTVKQIREKLVQRQLTGNQLPEIAPFDKSAKEAVRNWLIQVYATYNGLQDPNWLNELISREKSKGNFNSQGQRLKLADGLPLMFDFDTTLWYSIDTLVASAIRQQAMPGCQLLVAKDGYVVLDKTYGFQTYDSLRSVAKNTLYDLASLTKVLATTQALQLLYDDGKFDPNKKLSEYLPYLQGTNKEDITGVEVLSHQADLYLYFPFWKKAGENFDLKEMHGSVQVGNEMRIESWVADSIVHWAAQSDLLSDRVDTVSRRQYFYSDVGFFFLKDLAEELSGTTLDTFLTERLYQPNGIDLVFNPLQRFPDSLIAPTEFDRALRNELVRGYVHDRNAALLGGVAGQAGLFGSAREIAKLMQLHLDLGQYNGEHVLSTEVVKEFTRRHFEQNRRGLGWDMPGTEPDGPVSAYASAGTFGHTGFTGGMVWADPKENLIFVFLSNRVYPEAENSKLIEMNIRTRIQDLIYQSLGYQ